MLKLFGSPRRSKPQTQNLVDEVEASQPCNPYTQIRVLSEHTNIVRIVLQIGTNRFASAGDDSAIIIWNIQSGRQIHILKAHHRPITCLHVLHTIAPSGEQLLSAASDKLIGLWDIDVGCLLRQLTAHHGIARCFADVPGGGLFCSGGDRFCLWTQDGCLLDSLDRDKQDDITQMIYLRDQRIVGTVDKRLVVYTMHDRSDGSLRVVTLRALPPHREAIKCLLKINEACFASGSLDGTIMLWSAQALAPSRYFNAIEDYLGDSRVYPYSVQALVCVAERYLVCAIGTGVCIYDIIPGRMVAEKTHAHHSKITSLDIVHNGELLATTSEDGSIRLWGSNKTFSTEQSSTNTATNTVGLSKLLGVTSDDLRLLRDQREKIQPHLVGECLGHQGAVTTCVDAGTEGFITAGVDGLLINWKDGVEMSIRQNQQLQDLYRRLSTLS